MHPPKSIKTYLKDEAVRIAKMAKEKMANSHDPGIKHKYKIIYDEFSRLAKEVG